MDEGSHPVPDDDSSHVAKRRKTSHGNTSALKKLAYDQYTIAWICALHIEMAAARAVLDEIHQKLPVLAGDSNNYVMGSIQQHNIVIACLPAAQYGTNNAANVMTNLKRSFPSIVYGLMVGIGGGIPTKADIRLGDIVIGTRVTQHDMGKIVGDGQLKRTGVPKLPAPFLSTAVSSLRSTHELEPSRVPSILRAKFAQHPEYRRPSVPDRLFKVTYPHKNELYDCEECDSEQLVHRDPRSSHDPVIHYGGIASGNQVMRYSSDRDDIARELDVLCFEMEAAGLMDILACLSIRGICDYSDSHKSKEWQRYAAAAAAAYTKELLEQIPPNKSQVPAVLVLNDRE
jgi:nucleoside phosphorylase